MKKIIKAISIISVIFLICLVFKLNILDFSAFNIDEQKLINYSGYYFSQLEQIEKEIYVKIDDAVKDIRETVWLGSVDTMNLSDKINRVITAYFYDNPDKFYISNEYVISTSDLKFIRFSTLKLSYIVNSKEQLDEKNKQLEQEIERIIAENVTDEMTEFEKEVALHDALVKQVNYYKYENINEIPGIKHTAYGALVQHEAVCDGYSKAFKLLLEKVGIENIIIHGVSDNVAHAWNVVDIAGEYYHVDVTSDKINEPKKYAIHTYFNLSDEQISKTHNINEEFNTPKCNYSKYEYYNKKGYYISEQDSLYHKLKEIVTKQKKSSILEIKVDEKYTARNIIDILYELDFNNWYSDRQSNVEYTKVQDKYIFVK